MRFLIIFLIVLSIAAFTPAPRQQTTPEPSVCPVCIDLSGNLIYEGCMIKGNINNKGNHIYHCPRWRDYDKTKIDEENGERWFCTEAEAKAAGWRKPKYKTGLCR